MSRIAALLLVLAGCGGSTSTTSEPAPSRSVETPPSAVMSVQALDVSAPISSGEPGLVAGPDGAVHLTWIEAAPDRGHRLQHTIRPPGGGAWGATTTIASGTDWIVNWADRPSLAVGADGRLAAHWLVAAGEAKNAYHVWAAVSSDAGATWSEPTRLHDDDSDTEHGFATLLPPTESGTLAIWLDGRAMVEEGAPMSLRSRTIGLDGKLGPEQLIDDRTCDCCPTAAVALPQGGTIAAWRDRTVDEIRDVAISRLIDGSWESPRIVAADKWKLTGCPVNGPALDARGGTVALAWFTNESEHPRVQVALSADGGATFGSRAVLSENSIGRVDVVALPDGGAVVTWIERGPDPESAWLMAARVDGEGTLLGTRAEVSPISPLRRSGMPRAELGGEGEVVLAWTEVGGTAEEPTTRIRTATLGR